ncbi:MAG TPA: DUF1080 domain-containing protein [Methylomirabilota bacterium]|nr:DUF1080 domain-containing protein [Methylomirabilota bacterium]
MKAFSMLCALLVTFSMSAAELNQLTSEEKAAGWKLIFNGKDLSGWRQYAKQTPPGPGWKVEDGILQKAAGERGGDIVTTNKFDDFEFSWEWRIEPKGNNGIKYLVTEQRTGAPGHEYQLIDDKDGGDAGAPKRQTASFYDVLPPNENKPIKKAGEWNSSRVLIKGNHVEHWLNGAKVLEYELGSEEVKAAVAQSKFKSAAKFGEKIQGHLMLTDHSDPVWLRKLMVRELK